MFITFLDMSDKPQYTTSICQIWEIWRTQYKKEENWLWWRWQVISCSSVLIADSSGPSCAHLTRLAVNWSCKICFLNSNFAAGWKSLNLIQWKGAKIGILRNVLLYIYWLGCHVNSTTYTWFIFESEDQTQTRIGHKYLKYWSRLRCSLFQKRSRMGRKKISIQRITDERNRQVRKINKTLSF